MEIKKYENILQEIEKDFMDIPFGNSLFQIKHFILNTAETPERIYRTIGLQMHSKITFLKDAYYTKEEKLIDLEELEYNLKKEESSFERRRIELKIKKTKDGLMYSEKTINDAVKELDYYYNIYKKMPKFTNEEFEKAEFEYYSKNLHKQAVGLTGALESLYNMGLALDDKGNLIKHGNLLQTDDISKKIE
jgi:hypothetical protein